MRYSPELHNPVALHDQLTDLHTNNPDTRLVGSLGRAVLLGDPVAEYRLRNEHPLRNRHNDARDLDLITSGWVQTTGPFPLDTVSFNNPSVRISKHGNDWWLHSDEKKFAEPLHPDTMQPIEGTTVYDIPVVTLPWQTHLALTQARGVPRRKDEQSIQLLAAAGEARGNTLPGQLYAPFQRLQQIPEPAGKRMLRSVYRRIPRGIDHAVSPLLKHIGMLPKSE